MLDRTSLPGSRQLGSHLEDYQYLGLSTVVKQTEGNGVVMTLIGAGLSALNTDGGDPYTGLDRFGRMIDQVYITGSGTITGRLQYSFDRDGNVVAKTNLLDSSLSETYTFDNLGRIASATRGGRDYQSWTLDAIGNASSVTTTGSTQNRTTDALNQLTSVGTATLTYDHNGNTTTDDQGHKLLYDAWNRLVAVKTSNGTAITAYAYDAAGRRISESPAADDASDLYYSSNRQIIEEHKGSTTYQIVYGATYVDSMVLRDTFVDGNLTLCLYPEQDNQYNVTAITDATGAVVQRYQIDTYGTVLILNADFSVQSGQITLDEFGNLYQGKRRDFKVNLDDWDNRIYGPSLERFIQADPMGYVDGASRYAGYFAMQGGMDPSGLDVLDGLDPKQIEYILSQCPELAHQTPEYLTAPTHDIPGLPGYDGPVGNMGHIPMGSAPQTSKGGFRPGPGSSDYEGPHENATAQKSAASVRAKATDATAIEAPTCPIEAAAKIALSRDQGQRAVDNIHSSLNDPKAEANRTTTLTELKDGRLIVTSSSRTTGTMRSAAKTALGNDVIIPDDPTSSGYIPPAQRDLPMEDNGDHGEGRGIQAGIILGSPARRQWSSSAANHGGAACDGCEGLQIKYGIINSVHPTSA